MASDEAWRVAGPHSPGTQLLLQLHQSQQRALCCCAMLLSRTRQPTG
jgi:hypothetical protein